MPIDVESVISLYAKEAAACYGSGLVSQLEHALQATQLALAEGASAELSAAAFLHDIGHLVAGRSHARGREVPDLGLIGELLQEAADCHKTAIAGA
jgi:predicted HD phosphohydrolase